MTSQQVDRMLILLERYVIVEEIKLQLAIDTLKIRNALEERTTTAVEKQAEGMKITGDLHATHQTSP